MSFESFSKNNQTENKEKHDIEVEEELDIADDLSMVAQAMPQDTQTTPLVGIFVTEEAANDPVYEKNIPPPTTEWPSGINYEKVTPHAPVAVPTSYAEEIVIEDKVGDLAMTTQERAHMREAIAEAKRQEAEVVIKKAGFFSRIKGWFAKEKPDDRTLDERLAELEGVDPKLKSRQAVAKTYFPNASDLAAGDYEEVTLDATTLPYGYRTETEHDRLQMEALRDVARLHDEEGPDLPITQSFFARLKGWFIGEKQDDRTLEERLKQVGTEKSVVIARKKLALDPTSLTRDELFLLNKAERNHYLQHLSKIEVEKRSKLWAAQQKLSNDPASLTEEEVELFGPNQKGYYERQMKRLQK